MTDIIYWLKGEAVQNFGDHLTEVLMDRLFYDIRPDDVEMRLIGSCIDDDFVPEARSDEGLTSQVTAVFWGCGIRNKGGLSESARKSADIRAVRGPISANELRLGADFAMGDPALMLPALYTPKQRSSFIGKSVCIPHFLDRRSDQDVLEATGADIVLRPNIPNGTSHLFSFVDALTSADFVLSASLHGAIIAAAYQRSFSYWRAETIDLPLKWEDFSASVGIETLFVDNVEQGKCAYADKIKQSIAIPSTLSLLAAAPFPLKESGLISVLNFELSRVGIKYKDEALSKFCAELELHQEYNDNLVKISSKIIKDNIGKQGAERQLDLFSRLLGKIHGGAIPSNPVAVAEGLLDLHGRIVSQQERLQRLDIAETRVADAERSLVELALELKAADARAADLASDLDTAHVRLADAEDRAAETIALLRTELEEARKSARSSANKQAQEEKIHARRRNFAALHRAIRAELVDAQVALNGRCPAAPATSGKAWKHRLLGLPAPFHTAIFDTNWIARARPDLGAISPAAFVANPQVNAVDPHPLFCAREYLANNPDVAATGISPLRHYVERGWREGRDPHRWFANDWYLQQNPDVLSEGSLNPLDHYLQYGWREGRRPNPVFDPRDYLDLYADVAQANAEPLTHYTAYGEAEGRAIALRQLDPDWWHFVSAEQRSLSPMDYLLRAPIVEAS